MWYIAIGVVLFIWLLIAGAVNLATGYRHTRTSLAGLLGVLLFAAAVAQLISRTLLAASPLAIRILVGVAFTVPLFVLLGTVMAEVWKRHQGKPGGVADDGRRREEECLARLAQLERELEQLSARQRELEEVNREKLDRQWRLRAAVEKWEQGGGIARIRATKVRQWQEELGRLREEELGSRRRRLEEEMVSETDAIRREQLQIRGYLVELELLARALAQPNRELDELRLRQQSLTSQRDSYQQELARLRQEWQDRRRRELRSGRDTRLP